MINGNIDAFTDSLAMGMELEVVFRGQRYFIQGWDWSEKSPASGPHLEMFKLVNGNAGDYVFRCDAASRGECVETFLGARLWDGLTFWEAEPEIEWIG